MGKGTAVPRIEYRECLNEIQFSWHFPIAEKGVSPIGVAHQFNTLYPNHARELRVLGLVGGLLQPAKYCCQGL